MFKPNNGLTDAIPMNCWRSASKSRDNGRTPMQWDARIMRALPSRAVDWRLTTTKPNCAALDDPDSVFYTYQSPIRPQTDGTGDYGMPAHHAEVLMPPAQTLMTT